MNDAIQSFMEWKTLGRKRETVRGYGGDLRLLCLFLRNPDVESITIEQVIEYINMMLALGWDENSFIHKSTAYRKFFEYCAARGVRVLDHRLIPIPRQERKIPRVVTLEHYRQLLSVIPLDSNDPRHIRNRAYINMLWETGARLSELLSLDVSDLDLTQRKAVIRTKKSRGKRPFREIMWREETAESLPLWLAKREHLAKRAQFVEPDALFISVANQLYGGRMNKSGIGEMLRRYSNKAGLPYMNAHSFRHHFCHDVVKNGGSSSDVMNLAGHSSLNSSTIYTMMFGKELEERYRVLLKE